MLFNSYIFIFIFLPIVLLGYYLLGKTKYPRIAIAWLVGSSFFFYSWWNPAFLGLLLLSIIFNYAMGMAITGEKTKPSTRARKILLTAGVAANLFLLGLFKYAVLFLDTFDSIFKLGWHFEGFILPLAISFFTFQQIAYLIDTYQGRTKEYKFLHYCLFVTFFPQLIAGPIVHHKEMLPQFARPDIYILRWRNLGVGLTIFIIGLFKKVIIADQMALYASPVFNVAADGVTLTFFEAWFGVFAYSFQIYFDFSAYSDMAIGLGRLFGIRLPLNFYSPYKATSVIEFWRRWHMTLSRFLKDYLYIPLGGNRKGQSRRYLNLLITMTLGGLWHGAAWTFVAWGIIHGVYLLINHAWRSMWQKLSFKGHWMLDSLSCLLTFFSVTIAWVFFRAASFETALNIIKSLFGMNGIVLWGKYKHILNKIGGLGDKLADLGWEFGMMDFFSKQQAIVILLGFLIVWALPNPYQIMTKYRPALIMYERNEKLGWYKWILWKPTILWAAIIAIIFLITVSGFLGRVSEFIYWQF